MSSIDIAGAVSETLDDAAVETPTPAWVETAVTVTFVTVGVLIVSLIAVLTGLA